MIQNNRLRQLIPTLGKWTGLVTASVLLGALTSAIPTTTAIEGLHYDLTLAQNSHLFSDAPPHTSKNVAIIGIDERTLSEYGGYPRIFLAPKWAELIEALDQAEVGAIGFDLVFAYPDKFFRDGWESSFLASLNRHKTRIVLGRTARSFPELRFQAAFDFADPNSYMGAIEMTPDEDGIVRSVPTAIPGDDSRGSAVAIPSLVSLLLQRADTPVPSDEIRLAPRYKIVEDIPAYALSDVLTCASRGRTQVIAAAFAGRIVVIGSTIKGEDESRGLDRFFGRDASRQSALRAADDASDCQLSPAGSALHPGSLVPNVYLHAAAIEQVASGRVIASAGVAWRVAFSAAACLIALAAVVKLRLASALIAILGLVLVVHGVSSTGLSENTWIPAGALIAIVLSSSLAAYMFRFFLVDKARRQIRRQFKYYVSDRVIEGLVEQGGAPQLGGEQREITVMFADLTGYTSQSDRLEPSALMAATNKYLTVVANCIEEHGGYVDKFIGDEVMAIWGAPVDNHHHAHAALVAAISIRERIGNQMESDRAEGAPNFSIKIAVNSGLAIVGNVGSKTRMNFTAVGRTVNIAARLAAFASENRLGLVVGEGTACQVLLGFPLQELEPVQLKGIENTIRVFTLSDGRNVGEPPPSTN